MEQTRVDAIVRRLKNHPLLATTIVVGGVIGAGVVFANQTVELWSRTRSAPTLEVVEVRVVEGVAALEAFRRTWFPSDSVAVVWRTSSTTADDTSYFLGGPASDSMPVWGALGAFPMVDIIIRNPGDRHHVINRVEVRARRLRAETHTGLCSPFAPTWKYHLLLNSDRRRQSLDLPLAQLVRSDSSDRFVLVIGHDGAVREAQYELRVTLRYDGNSELVLPPLDVTIASGCGAGPILDNLLIPVVR